LKDGGFGPKCFFRSAESGIKSIDAASQSYYLKPVEWTALPPTSRIGNLRENRKLLHCLATCLLARSRHTGSELPCKNTTALNFEELGDSGSKRSPLPGSGSELVETDLAGRRWLGRRKKVGLLPLSGQSNLPGDAPPALISPACCPHSSASIPGQ